MRHELVVGGVLISPFVAYAVGAFAVLLVLRRVSRWMGLGRWLANPPLAEAGVYICVLALLIVLL